MPQLIADANADNARSQPLAKRLLMLPALRDQLRRLCCTTLHWHRERNSYGLRCPKCDIYW